MKTKINLRDLKLKRLRFKRLKFRTGLISLGIVATVILAFNFWFIDHAEEALEQIVYSQSKGKLRLKVKKFKFNWLSNKIELHQASIYSTDTTTNAYAVNSKKIHLRPRGFLPFLFNREVLIDSINIASPSVIFTRYTEKTKLSRADKDSIKAAAGDSTFSVAREMGRITQSITDAINVLHIDKFRLDNGRFVIVDRTRPEEYAFAVSNIYILLDNLQLDSTKLNKKRPEKITFTDNIAVRTFNQNIAFPGGRHFIAFKDFRINLQKKRVEFDSCTLRAIKGDSSQTAFRIFFDKLQLTNINFDSLYSSETIVADSVFCSNPQIFLDIDADQKGNGNAQTEGKKVGVEKVDAVIQQLLGDLALDYVGVKNAQIDVNTIKKGTASNFSSRDNNFEMFGLRLRRDNERPIHLDKFVMSLHNYENVLKDGRFKIAFDSIRFEDDVISLSRFSFKEFRRGQTIKSLDMSFFNVQGLSWESLLYDNVFSARSAEFRHPVVNYTTAARRRKSEARNLFTTLNSIDDVMDLHNLNIIDGDITLRFPGSASLSLSNTNLDLRANELTSASQIRNVQRSVNALSFSTGIFRKDDLQVLLRKVILSPSKSGLRAESMDLHSDNIDAKANKIDLGNILLNRDRQSIMVQGVDWNQASISMNSRNTPRPEKTVKQKRRGSLLVIQNVKGLNTKVNLELNQNNINGYFNIISLDEFISNVSGRPAMKGLSLDGRDFLLLGKDIRISAGEMNITDKNFSEIKNILFEKTNAVDTIHAVIPKLTIIPNITEITDGRLNLQGLVLTEPVLDARLGKKENNAALDKKTAGFHIGSALLERPDIQLRMVNKKDSASHIRWEGVQLNSYLKITNLESTQQAPLKADQIKMFLTHFEFIDPKGKKLATNDNKLHLEFNDVLFNKNDTDQLGWKANLNILSLDKLSFDSLGKNNAELYLDKGDVRNIALNSEYIHQPAAIIANSGTLLINGTNGRYKTTKNQLEWKGLTVEDRILGFDSFSLVPHQSAEEYKIAKAFNEDYLSIHAGKISAGPIHMERYSSDSILSIPYVQMSDINLFTFKDKTQPDTLIKYKPLPVEMLSRINSGVNIDSIRLHNMQVTYWEINPDTDTLGVVPVKNLEALMRNIRNYNLQPTDSIYILASADVLGTLHTQLDVAQSYTDSSGYMRMKLQTGPMDLTEFNTVLIPLVGAKVFNGRLNSLEVNAKGNNEAAIGSAYMNYRGLKLGLLNKSDLPNQTFINKLVSKIAMAFVVRKNNHGKESPVFFERLQEKSAINYIIKTTLEGIKSGIGLPGAKKKLRKYKKRTNHQSRQLHPLRYP